MEFSRRICNVGKVCFFPYVKVTNSSRRLKSMGLLGTIYYYTQLDLGRTLDSTFIDKLARKLRVADLREYVDISVGWSPGEVVLKLEGMEKCATEGSSLNGSSVSKPDECIAAAFHSLPKREARVTRSLVCGRPIQIHRGLQNGNDISKKVQVLRLPTQIGGSAWHRKTAKLSERWKHESTQGGW